MKKFFCIITAVAICIGTSAPGANKVRPQKEWAFLIFLNGHNDLHPYSDLNINQLETVGSTSEIDVIVQWAKWGNDKTYRLKVEKDNDIKSVSSPILQQLPRVDMGDYKEMVKFVQWSVEHYPAKRYFISFWNHGSGWHRRSSPAFRDVSFDDYTKNKITTEQMGLALKEMAAIIGHKVDIVGADACLMAMLEVASEMADYAQYFVASEETEPALGWPYDTFLKRWADKPFAPSYEISSYLVEEYHKYMEGKDGITLSAMELERLPQLWHHLSDLAMEVLSLSDDTAMALKKAAGDTIRFRLVDYADLGSFLLQVEKMLTPAINPAVLINVKDSLSKLVVANLSSDSHKGVHGASIWLPLTTSTYHQHAARYEKLRFNQITQFNEVLRKLALAPVCFLHPNGQWATEVLSFSSEYSISNWGASQTLGPCNTEGYGDSVNAWAPSLPDGGEQYVTVKFSTPVYSTGTVIRETLGSGSVVRVETTDTSGNAAVVWEGKDPSAPGMVADLRLDWPKTQALINGLRVTLDTNTHLSSWEEIDSIQLIGEP